MQYTLHLTPLDLTTSSVKRQKFVSFVALLCCPYNVIVYDMRIPNKMTCILKNA